MIGTKLGIDFGTSNLKIYAEGKGIVLNEPSVMILDAYDNTPLAIGNEARDMLGKLPASMRAVYPIKDGIVSDIETSCVMLRSYIDRLCAGKLCKPNVLMCVPNTVTTLEKKTIFDVIMAAGAARACFVDESLSSAIGAGVSLTEPKGIFVCDIGGGITDCAVVTMGNIAVSRSVKIGGNDFNKTISDYVQHEYNIRVGHNEAEKIKLEVGTAVLRNEEVAVISSGQDLDTKMPVHFELTSTEVYWLLKTQLDQIAQCIRSVLEITPPELCADIIDNGIVLTGGCANLFGLDSFIEWSTGLKTKRAKDAELCAALGLGRLLHDMKYLEKNGYVFDTAEEEYNESEA